MKEYTVVIRVDDHFGRIIEARGILSPAEFEAVTKALGNIYMLPVNKEIKVEI